ncbi:MAG: glycosyltransferase, partial [Pseudomonadota bacterium]
MTALNILFVTQGYKPAYRLGGPIVSVAALAEAIVARGHSVTVATTNSNLDEDIDVPLGQGIDRDGVEVFYFKRRQVLARLFPFIPTIGKALGFSYAPDMRPFLQSRMDQFDLVHTQLPFTYPTWLASKMARRFGKPLFYHQRGVFHPERLNFRSWKKRAYIRAVERPILDAANTLIALTSEEIDSYAALGTQTPVRVIPNGINPDVYRREPRARALDLPDDATVVLFMGRVHPAKGADRLLEAFIRLQADYPQARLVLAGPNEFGLEAEFRERVVAAGLEDRILFPGMMSGEPKLDLLARADVFVLPSDGEGFSMAILEALASATPVLISPGCHFDEVAQYGAGRVVDNDAASVESGLRALLDDPQGLPEMGQKGYELVRARYSW